MTFTMQTHTFRIEGMDCTSCAAKVESAARSVPGITDAHVSIVSRELAFDAESADAAQAVRAAVYASGYGATPVEGGETVHQAPAYRRALWIVVILNAGYGIIEAAAGYFADSQALLADALDFIGDGSITLLGLLAIGWSKYHRAATAWLQGMFLGLLGIGVLAATAYRTFVLNEPSAEMMGGFGLAALAVNVAAAMILMEHRNGDANVKAVWLFSRNDALGNAAVVVASVLVAMTGSPLPDLLVALVIAALFLQSAWVIIRDARLELRGLKK